MLTCIVAVGAIHKACTLRVLELLLPRPPSTLAHVIEKPFPSHVCKRFSTPPPSPKKKIQINLSIVFPT